MDPHPDDPGPVAPTPPPGIEDEAPEEDEDQDTRPATWHGKLRSALDYLLIHVLAPLATPRPPAGLELVTRRLVINPSGPNWANLNSTDTLKPNNLLGGIAEIFRAVNNPGEDVEIIIDRTAVGDWAAKRYRRKLRKLLDQSANPTNDDGDITGDRTGLQGIHAIGEQIRLGLGRSNGPATTTTGAGRPRLLDQVRYGLNPKGAAPQASTQRSGRGRNRGTRPYGARLSPSARDQFAQQRAATHLHLDDKNPLWHVTIYIRVRCWGASTARGTAKALFDQLAALKGQSASLKRQGVHVPFWHFIGADLYGIHQAVDRAIALFHMPRKGKIVSTAELLPLISPANRYAHSTYIRRAADIPPPPGSILVYDRDDPDHRLIGETHTADGRAIMAACTVGDANMTETYGGTGSGKSTKAGEDIVHRMWNTDDGITALDPEAYLFKDEEPFLARSLLPVNLIDIREPDNKVPGMNVIDMVGRKSQEIDGVAGGVTNAIVGALWGPSAGRASTALTQTLTTCLNVNDFCVRVGAPDVQATLFSITRLLENETFREAFYPYIPESLEEWWKTSFKGLDAAARTTVTNLPSRLLGTHSAIGAMLGRSVSSYRPSRSMAEGHRTYICTSDGGINDKALTAIVVALLKQDARKRPPDALPRHKLILEELPELDYPAGSAVPLLALLRKRGFDIDLLSQTPATLAKKTRVGIAPNLNVTWAATATGDNAKMLAAMTTAPVEAFGDLAAHHWIVRGRRNGLNYMTSVRGVPAREIWADRAGTRDEIDLMYRRMDAYFDRKRRADVQKEIATADSRLLTFLHDNTHRAPRNQTDPDMVLTPPAPIRL